MTDRPLLDRRVLFFGGKGGVGKTTLASTFAVLAADHQLKTLLVSTDPAHSTSDVFDLHVGPEPTPLTDHLFAMEIDPEREAAQYIKDVKARIAALKAANEAGTFDERTAAQRTAYVKAIERIFRRLDDGTIFPANSLDGVNSAIAGLDAAKDHARGDLVWIEALLFPGLGIVKSRTQCTEQGSARWLPKPTDVVATFLRLANPDIEGGGGYKGIPLLWWKWLPVADVVGFFAPDWIADLWPGDYSRHGPDGGITLNFKDKLLEFARGDVYLGVVPMLDGHLWDSVFRVLVALALGILLGVPLGLFMGVSRFFKSFFDPLIELYRRWPN